MTNHYYLRHTMTDRARVLIDEQTLPHVETQVQRRFAGLLGGLLRLTTIHKGEGRIVFVPFNFRNIF